MKNSRYNLFHALAATAVMVYMAFSQGVAHFWHSFLHGAQQQFTPETLPLILIGQFAFFAVLILVLWGSTFIIRWIGKSPKPEAPPVPSRLASILFTLKISVPVACVALGLCYLYGKLFEWLTGEPAASQELVKCFIDPAYPMGLRALMALSVAVLAPLTEELLFRGIIFRGFARTMPLVAAMVVSGFLFAFVHINAASFIPLWFLGIAFAWLYARTRTILAPMVLHCVFNSANLLLLIFFPELAS